MANKTISDFPAVTVVDPTDIYHVRQGLTDKNVTVELIAQYGFRSSDYGVNTNSISSNTTMDNTLKTMIEVFRGTTTGGDITLTLPIMGINVSPGMMVVAYNETGANNFIVAYATGEETVLQPGSFQHFIWNGVTWEIVESAVLLPDTNQTLPTLRAKRTVIFGDPNAATLDIDISNGAKQTGNTCYVINVDSTDNIDLDLSGTRTITILPGESVEVMWDGTAWFLITPERLAPTGDATYTIFESIETVIIGDPSGATLNLDVQAGAVNRGAKLHVHNADATNSIALTIAAATVVTILPGGYYNFVWSGNEWDQLFPSEIPVTTTVKTLDNTDSPYTIPDSDTFRVYLVDTSGGDVDVILPTLADNQGRIVEIVHAVGGGTLNVDGEGAETIESVTDIDLPLEGNSIKVIGASAEWKTLVENISCQLRLNTFAGYGSVDTAIIRMSSVIDNYGNLFTENHTGGYNGNTEGLEITIQKPGEYELSAYAQSAAYLGFSVNSSTLTANINDVTPTSDILNYDFNAAGGTSPSVKKRFAKNDVIRFHGTTGTPPTSNRCGIVVSYCGK